ncbi:MAG TPA: response regulator [Terracidiphilus sp.]
MIPSSSSQTSLGRRTVLLVDDDPFLAYSRKFVLEREFNDVLRATDAAEAFIRLDEPGVADRLLMVIVALGQPGVAGPAFVNELTFRIYGVPILVLGRTGEVAHDYRGEQVHFLPRHATPEDVLAGALDILAHPHPKVA